MDAYDCGCNDTVVTEGIFGEIRPDTRRSRKYADEEAEDYMEGSSTRTSISDDEIDGILEPVVIKSYTMVNTNRMEVTVITWGATIVSLKCPDKFGRSTDVVLGFDDLESYRNPVFNPFIGCILGRCANRIKGGFFSIKDRDYQLSKNEFEKHHLHGGACGFGRRVWDSHLDGCTVVMSYMSEDNEEGYPGAVLTTVKFKLTPDNKLEICIRATTSKPTVMNISHGTHFNLAGHDAGEVELRNHAISLNCDKWTFAEFSNPIPTGAVRGVGGTVMDLRIPRSLGDRMDKIPGGEGFDHNFCVVKSWQPGPSFVAKVFHKKSGRVLEVYSDQPGVQLYTGGRLPPQLPTVESASYESNEYDREDLENYTKYGQGDAEQVRRARKRDMSKIMTNGFLKGKQGARYEKNCAFSIQPQHYPNAVNYAHFPCPILYPGQVYYHDLTYKFGVQLASHM